VTVTNRAVTNGAVANMKINTMCEYAAAVQYGSKRSVVLSQLCHKYIYSVARAVQLVVQDMLSKRLFHRLFQWLCQQLKYYHVSVQ
jgi:hypothetical protein